MNAAAAPASARKRRRETLRYRQTLAPGLGLTSCCAPVSCEGPHEQRGATGINLSLARVTDDRRGTGRVRAERAVEPCGTQVPRCAKSPKSGAESPESPSSDGCPAVCSADDLPTSDPRRRARGAVWLRARLPCYARAGGVGAAAAIDRDLLDVTVPQLHRLYADKKYTVTQVVQWHLDRIDRYNGVYGAIETVFRSEALAEAARQDAEAAQGSGARGRSGACRSSSRRTPASRAR